MCNTDLLSWLVLRNIEDHIATFQFWDHNNNTIIPKTLLAPLNKLNNRHSCTGSCAAPMSRPSLFQTCTYELVQSKEGAAKPAWVSSLSWKQTCPDWLVAKIWLQVFRFHLVCYQNFPTSHIWFAKSMANIFVQLFTTFARQIFSIANFGSQPSMLLSKSLLRMAKGSKISVSRVWVLIDVKFILCLHRFGYRFCCFKRRREGDKHPKIVVFL